MKQRTIKESFSISGNGIHTNKESFVIFNPSYGTGISFRVKGFSIPISIDFVLNTRYEISLYFNGYTIRTVEHVLSALYGLGISNCVIELSGLEMPILDGSSDSVTRGIVNSGTIEQDLAVESREIPYSIGFMGSSSYIFAEPCDQLIIYCIIGYPHPMLERQFYEFKYSKEAYTEELSRARTFGFINQWDSLKERGFALGANLGNVIIFSETSIKNPPLRYSDECVRHKVLDFIGALSFLRYRVKGKFYIYCSGHTLDIIFMRLLRSIFDNTIKKCEIDSIKKSSMVIYERMKKDFRNIF